MISAPVGLDAAILEITVDGRSPRRFYECHLYLCGKTLLTLRGIFSRKADSLSGGFREMSV